MTKNDCCNGTVDKVASALLLVGGINWGLAVFDFNLVSYLLWTWPQVEMVIYGLIGLAAVYLTFKWVSSSSS